MAQVCWDCISTVKAGSVRYIKHVTELFRHLQNVRDALHRLAPGERDALAAAFGATEASCERVARLLILLNGGVEIGADPEDGIYKLQREGIEAFVDRDRMRVAEGALQ